MLNRLSANAVVAATMNYLRLARDFGGIGRSIRFGRVMLVSRIAHYGYSTADSTPVGRLWFRQVSIGDDAEGPGWRCRTRRVLAEDRN